MVNCLIALCKRIIIINRVIFICLTYIFPNCAIPRSDNLPTAPLHCHWTGLDWPNPHTALQYCAPGPRPTNQPGTMGQLYVAL